LQGARLAVAADYLGSDAAQLSASERRFIELGLGREAQRAQEKTTALQQQVRQRQRLNYALGSFLLLALTLSGLAGWQGWRAQAQARVAQGLNTRLLGTNRTLQRTSQQVQENARRALAHKLSAQGLLATQQPSPLNGDPRLGALLATEAVTLDDNAQSRGNLLRVLQSELVLHSDGEQLSALSGDGRTLALTDSGRLSLWDTHRKVQTLELAPPGTLYLNSLSFGPEGRTLAATGLDGTLRLWRVADGLKLPAPELSSGYPTTASFSAGGELLGATLDGRLQVWTRSARAEGGWQQTASLSRSAPATTAPSQLLPSRRPSTLAPRDEHLIWLRGVALSPDGRTLALLDDAGAVALFRPPSATPLGRFVLPNAARSLTFAPDGGTLAVADREGRVTLLDLRTGAQTPLFTLGSLVTQLAFSPEGRVLAAAEVSGAVTLWPLDAVQPLAATLPLKLERVHQLAFAGTQLLIRAQEGTRTALYEVATTGASPALVRNLRVTWQEGSVALWDVTGSNALSAPLLAAADTFPQQLSFSPDGRRLSLRSDSRAVYLFGARSGRLLAGPLPGQDDIESVAFSPDSQTLVTGTREGDVALRDARTGRIRRRLPQTYGRALALAFHPGGHTTLWRWAPRGVSR
jgi:WD40 repeat protein